MSKTEAVRRQVFEHSEQHIELLRNGLKISLEDVDTFQEWVADRLNSLGASTNNFRLSRQEIESQPAFQNVDSGAPDVNFGTNVIGSYAGQTDTKTLLFAHADKNPRSYQQARHGHSIDFRSKRLHGPGIADDISGVMAMIGAIRTLAEGSWKPVTSVLLGSILGKQLGVGGTYGLMQQYAPADAAIYIHPAESGQGLNDLKIGSNGVYEFHVKVEGKQPDTSEVHHPLYAHRGINPFKSIRSIIQHLHGWVEEFSAQHTHPGVREAAGRSAGLLLSRINTTGSERAVYEMPQSCTAELALAFPPGISIEAVEEDVHKAVHEAASNAVIPSITLSRGDHIADSAETSTDAMSASTIIEMIKKISNKSPTFYYGHTASDIRYPINYWNAPTVGFGPKAENIGKRNEWISQREYLETVAALSCFLIEYSP